MPDVFEVLAEPSRRQIIVALRRGERSVNQLAEEVGLGQPGVSKQLRIMFEAGFVAVRQEGNRRFYSLRPEPFRTVAEWMDDYRHIWDARFDKLAAHLAQKQQKKQETDA